MSLSCVICQISRLISTGSRNLKVTEQVLLHKGGRTFRHFSVSTKADLCLIKKSLLKTTYSHNRPRAAIRKSNVDGSGNLFNATARWNGRGFCTKSKSAVNVLDLNSRDDVNRDQLRDDVGHAEYNDHNQNLTDEERQILKELEEEEQHLREQRRLENNDYDVWDGSFDFVKPRHSKLTGSVSEGHVPFENRQRIIQDVIEEMWNPLPQQIQNEDEELQYFPRGKTGVFDLGELVELLREEKASEVVAISLPKEIDYADHMVIVTVGNNKHLLALATFVRKRYKMKDRKPSDVLPVLDKSMNHQGWIALDLGNIILHIFLQDIRDYYDLETLWTVGPVFDDLTNAQDSEIIQLLNEIK